MGELLSASRRSISRSCATFFAALDRGRTAQDMDLPGFRLHALKGVWKGIMPFRYRELAGDVSL